MVVEVRAGVETETEGWATVMFFVGAVSVDGAEIVASVETEALVMVRIVGAETLAWAVKVAAGWWEIVTGSDVVDSVCNETVDEGMLIVG